MPTNLKTPTFDTIDIKIIKILSDNARTSASSIATEIGMSPPSVSERIKRLTETGIIRKFTIELNPELIGYPFSAIVRIKPLPGKIHILQQRLIGLDNCIQCDNVTGEDCFIAKLVLQSIPELDDVLESIVELAQTSTAIIKKSPVHNRLPALY